MTNHYIRQNANGINNGNDWANAWTNTPTTFIRGDTYYFANGTYNGTTLSTSVSGSQWIKLLKATTTNHGTDIGWDNLYGNGQAIIGRITITTSYWEINGQTRTSWKSGHGFKIIYNTYGIDVLGSGITNLTFKYIETYGSDPDGGSCGYAFLVRIPYASNYIISYNYLHHQRGGFIGMAGVNGALIEHNYLQYNGSDSDCHGNPISDNSSDNVVVRYNMFADLEGTNVITLMSLDCSPRLNENWEIYGNVFFRTADNPYNRSDIDFGIVACINLVSGKNIKVYNNTIVNMNDYTSGVHMRDETYCGIRAQEHQDIYVYNNLWYNSLLGGLRTEGGGSNCTNCNSDYNYYMGTTHITELHEENYVTLDPTLFVSITPGLEDFHLTRSTSNSGLTNGLNNIDMDGNIRGSDGIWDKGAYEYISDSTCPQPIASFELKVI